MAEAPDDRLIVRGLSAVLPPNDPKQLDLEITLGEARILYRIIRRSRDWAIKRYWIAPDGVHRGGGSPFETLQDALYDVLIDPLMGRLLEEDRAIDHPGAIRQYAGPMMTESLEDAERVFGPLSAPPQRPTLGGPSPGPDDSRFLGWVPGPDRAVPYEGGFLRVLMVELYEEGIAVIWHVSDAPRVHETERDEHGDFRARVNPSRFSVTDNTRQRYQQAGGSGHLGARHVHGRRVYHPGVGPDARWLNVTIEGHRFRIDLPPAIREKT